MSQDDYAVDQISLEMAKARLKRERDRRAQRKWGYIYFAAAGDMVKIGASRQPADRVATLRSGQHQNIELVGFIYYEEFLYDREHAIHSMFHIERRKGEWFYLSKDLIAWIQKNTMRPPNAWMRVQKGRKKIATKSKFGDRPKPPTDYWEPTNARSIAAKKASRNHA